MYLHAGNGFSVRCRDIIGIFDFDNATVSTVTRRTMSEMQRAGLVVSAAEELPKSFILFRDQKTVKLCLSPLSSSALRGRIGVI